MTYKEFKECVKEWTSKQPGQIVVDGKNEGFFHVPCHCCQRENCAGDRFRVFICEKDGSVHADYVCEDCLFFLEYGYLDIFEGEIVTD